MGEFSAGEAVFVVDDDVSVREGLTELIESLGLRVRAFASAQGFLASIDEQALGCLVLDVYMPGMTGLDLQRELKAKNVHLPIIFLTGHGDIPMTVHALKSGAVHFLTKPVREQELMEVIRQALEVDRAARVQRAELQELRTRLESLTRRQRRVMSLAVSGYLNKQIAHELGTSERTVKLHRGQVMRKMAAQSFADLVKQAEKLGLRIEADLNSSAAPGPADEGFREHYITCDARRAPGGQRETPSFCILAIKVVLGRPSRAAAPLEPPITQLVASNT
jgi:FixJ family two-component response regulator